MKIKNLVFGMMACAAFTACTSEDIIDNNPEAKLEGEAYVAINIVTSNGTSTRADGDFVDGEGNESVVTSATFLFFDANGKQCANKTVSGSELEDWKAGTGSIEKISSPVLLLNPVNGAIPTSVIAVLNAPADDHSYYTDLSLKMIKFLVGTKELYKKGFVMSNSTYAKNNETVIEVPLTIKNLAKTPELAKESPVVIPVERIVAKVSLNKAVSESATQTINLDGKDVTVKSVIKGWKVTATNPDSYLLKKIEVADWNTTFHPWKWNDEGNFRSYWAGSVTPDAYTYYSYNDAISNQNDSEYCLENTSAPWTQSSDHSTASKLWVVAQLVNEKNEPVSFMEWGGSKSTPNGVKASMAGILNKYHYVKNGTANVAGAEYETILPSHLDFIASTLHYKAKATLAKGAPKFYTIVTNADNSITATDATAALINEINSFPEALAWTDGMTYYYTNIQHTTADNGPVYGVVRNHVYNMTISKISGLGTPIFDPNSKIDPTKPSKTDNSYVAAKVQVLKWKVINQDVELD